jgi:hypothetical protein
MADASSSQRSFEVRLVCPELDDSRIQLLTRDLLKTLNQEGINAALPSEGEGVPGTKGIPLNINEVVLALVGSGGVAVGFVQVLKSFVERKSSIHFEVVRSDGQRLLLTAENLSQKQQQTTTGVVETFLKG